MNKFKIISMAAAAIIVITGAIYLFTDLLPVSAVLFLSSAMLCIMGFSLFAEQRKLKAKTVGEYIFSICFFVLSLAVLAAAVASL